MEEWDPYRGRFYEEERPSVHLGQDNEGGDDNGQGGLPFQAGVLSHAAKRGLRLL